MAMTDLAPRASVSVLRILATPFVAFGKAIMAISESNAQVRRARFLMDLSDTELAARGLKRDEIIQHVFSARAGI